MFKTIVNQLNSYPPCPLSLEQYQNEQYEDVFQAWRKELIQYCWDNQASYAAIMEYSYKRMSGKKQLVTESVEQHQNLTRIINTLLPVTERTPPVMDSRVDVVDLDIRYYSDTVVIKVYENAKIEAVRGSSILTNYGLFSLEQVGLDQRREVVILTKPYSAVNNGIYLHLKGESLETEWQEEFIKLDGWKIKMKIADIKLDEDALTPDGVSQDTREICEVEKSPEEMALDERIKSAIDELERRHGQKLPQSVIDRLEAVYREHAPVKEGDEECYDDDAEMHARYINRGRFDKEEKALLAKRNASPPGSKERKKYNDAIVALRSEGEAMGHYKPLKTATLKEGIGFMNGDMVELKPDYADKPGEVFRVSQCDSERGRCWIGDEDGRGWYVKFDQIVPVPEVTESWQNFKKKEPYAVCLAGKPVKQFDYYEQARRFHDNWKKKLHREGNKEKADKITLMPLDLKESRTQDVNFGHTVTPGAWIVHQDGKKPMRFKTHTGAKKYAEKNGGKVYSSEYYADKFNKQGVAEGSLSEIDFASNLGELSLSQKEIINQSSVVGTIGSRKVYLFKNGSDKIYFFVGNKRIDAMVYLHGNRLMAMKNFSANKGLIYNLFQYIINIKRLQVILDSVDKLTSYGIQWICDQIKRPGGFKITDVNGNKLDADKLYSEWEKARTSGKSGPTGIVIGESLDGKKIRMNEGRLMPMDIFGSTLKEITDRSLPRISMKNILESNWNFKAEGRWTKPVSQFMHSEMDEKGEALLNQLKDLRKEITRPDLDLATKQLYARFIEDLGKKITMYVAAKRRANDPEVKQQQQATRQSNKRARHARQAEQDALQSQRDQEYWSKNPIQTGRIKHRAKSLEESRAPDYVEED